MHRYVRAAVLTAYYVGLVGIHRLFPALEKLRNSIIYVVCSGREGTLPSVLSDLVNKPVIVVPVSTSYGCYMGHGESDLASMLKYCTAITVVNIDAGFTEGAVSACTASILGGKP